VTGLARARFERCRSMTSLSIGRRAVASRARCLRRDPNRRASVAGRRSSGRSGSRAVRRKAIDSSSDSEPREWRLGDGVRVDLDGPYVVFSDGASAGVDGDYDAGVLPETQVRAVRLATLDAALGMIAEDTAPHPVDVWFIDTDPPNRAYDVEPLPGVVLHTGGEGELCALVDIGLPRHVDEEFEARVESLLRPMVGRLGARVEAPFYAPSNFSDDFVVMVEFESMSEKSGGDLLDLAVAARAFLVAARAGEFNQDVAHGLVASGRPEVLLGQAESNWLEAKSQPWDLGSPSGKAEAAKDLSALANAEGGLIVIPAKTTKEGDRDVLSRVSEMPLDRFSATQLRDILAAWTFPPLRGVEIEIVDQGEGRGQILISVPAHRSEDWPHLVISDDKAAFPSSAVAAYVRDGDTNRALSAPRLHRLMSEPRSE
jgi:hypothetical protein